MRQTYSDKQREAQQRKKQEELLRKKSNPKVSPTTGTPQADADNTDQASKKTNTKNTRDRRSA